MLIVVIKFRVYFLESLSRIIMNIDNLCIQKNWLAACRWLTAEEYSAQVALTRLPLALLVNRSNTKGSAGLCFVILERDWEISTIGQWDMYILSLAVGPRSGRDSHQSRR